MLVLNGIGDLLPMVCGTEINLHTAKKLASYSSVATRDGADYNLKVQTEHQGRSFIKPHGTLHMQSLS